jgi:WD40 repeat protein
MLAYSDGTSVLIKKMREDASVTGDTRLYGHSGQVDSICWAYNNEVLVTGDQDGAIIMWNPVSASVKSRIDRRATLQRIRAIAMCAQHRQP